MLNRKRLAAEVELLTEQVGLLRAALDQKHCAADCDCRPAWFTLPATTAGTWTIPSSGSGWSWFQTNGSGS